MSTKIPQEVKSPQEVTLDSPETDTTFTVNFKKSSNPSSTHFVGDDHVLENETDRFMDPSEPVSPVTTTYTFTPAFMRRNAGKISSPNKEDEIKLQISSECQESCKYNRLSNDTSRVEEHISQTYSSNDPVSDDTPQSVHIRRKSFDIKNISVGLNDDDLIKECTNKKVSKQKRELGERFDNSDRWRSKQDYELDDDNNDDDDNDITSGDVNDNTCDNTKKTNQFETNVSKKITSKSAKNKKLLKTRRITDTDVTYDCDNEDVSNKIKLTGAETDEKPAIACEKHLEDSNSDEGKNRSSPKIVTRRLRKFMRKNSKDESNKCNVEAVSSSTNNFSTNYFNNNNNNDNENSTMRAVNVFVPTTRKIFSPVRRDSKGKMSSVIGYIVDEPESAPVITQNVDIFSRNMDNFQRNFSKTVTENRLCFQSESDSITENAESDSKGKSKESGFIMPPCWILKQTRAQSASPALQRRLFTYSRSKEKEDDRNEKDLISTRKTVTTDQPTELSSSPQTEMSWNNSENITQPLEHSDPRKETCAPVNTNNYSPNTNSNKDDNNKNNNLNFELPAENFKHLRKDTIGLPNLKFRSEAGFPPISPLSIRKEVKSPLKETAPSIRMMIARYNQKVTESQEVAGSKSPESGSASPVAWRSPATKRRVKAQMERYQEEVQRNLQNWVRRDFTGKVEVKKSASAGYIRLPEKEGSVNDLSNKSSSEETACRQIKLGILKSSSAGVIKTTSPLQLRSVKSGKIEPNEENSDKVLSSVVCDFNPNQFSDLKKNSFSERSDAWKLVKDSSESSVISQTSPQTSRARALKIKQAKEEFLSRGPGSESWSSECGGGVSENGSLKGETSTGIRFGETGNRLSQVSCESESSYDGGGTLAACSGQDTTQADDEDIILIKSASAGMINVDSSTCTRIFSDQKNTQELLRSEEGVTPKPRFGIFSRFRKARMRRHKEKNPKLETVSTLCRQSLVVDIQKKPNQDETEPVASTSKSCPSSPVLQKRDSHPSSWIRNPKKIFKPK